MGTAVVLDGVELPMLLGLDAIKQLQLRLDFGTSSHPGSPSRLVGGEAASDSSGGVGGGGHQLTTCRDVPKTHTQQQPQRPNWVDEVAYLRVAFLSTSAEEASRILGGVEASRDSFLDAW
eukprot:GHVS01102069.1.p1 GENE.GHVS01102069.1~~GHVS01102069.1.p1  ORF type:complete len:120 (-),score=26.57 GHVS01102069.1:1725-2084(-)